MSRTFLSIAAVALALGLFVAYAAFSLVETERKVLAAAEAEGRALLVAVSAGVEKSLQASRAVESLLSDRLLELGRDLDQELGSAPGREEAVLRRFAIRHRVKSALLLDREFNLVARATLDAPATAPSPVSGARLEPMVVDDLVRRVRDAGLPERDHVVVFGENPFGTRADFLVGLVMPKTGGFLLLRHDAEELRSFRRRAGVETLLRSAAETEAIAYLLIEDREGDVLVGSSGWKDRTGQGVLDIRIDARWEGFPPAVLHAGLVADPVRDVIERGRRSVYQFTALVLLVAAAGAAGLFVTIRARRGREAALRRELDRQERAVSMGRLAAGVAHEIRGPLNAIGMGAQRLEREFRADTPDHDRVRDVAPSIRREVSRLDRTVEEFLDLGRPRPLEIRDVDLTVLLDEIIESDHPAARREASDSSAVVRVDPDELRKAVGNLLRNARQAAGDAPVVVAWRRTDTGIEIEVRDGGPGIPPEEREQVFEHFFTGRPDGTGLGLAIVKSVVDRHGGRIEVRDAPEGGACFVMRLPNA